MKPKSENVTEVNIKKKIIINGCRICKSTNIFAVPIIIQPIINDLVAAAPTKPKIISKLDRGAAKSS